MGLIIRLLDLMEAFWLWTQTSAFPIVMLIALGVLGIIAIINEPKRQRYFND